MINMKSGIYKITNKINGKSYIGLSVYLKRRITEHKRQLKSNKHNNKYLQNSFNIHGEDNFTFEILEYCDVDKLNEREVYYIKLHDSFNNGYNLTPGGEDGSSGKYNGNANKTLYTFYHIDGLIEKDILITDLVEKYNLQSSSHVHTVAKGNRLQSYGWSINPDVIKLTNRFKKYTFYNIDGTITESMTQAEFCKKYRYRDSHISRIILNKSKQYKGWFKSKQDLDDYIKEQNNKLKTVINQNGEIKYNITQKQFRDLSGCDSCSSSKLFNGKYKEVKGWRLY